MSQFNCPHCEQPAFSWWDKYLAAKWKMLRCPHCDKRVCSLPLLLAFYYLFYLVDVIDVGYVFYLTSDLLYIGLMVGAWIILDYFSVYLPLTALRDTGSPDPTNHKCEKNALAQLDSMRNVAQRNQV